MHSICVYLYGDGGLRLSIQPPRKTWEYCMEAKEERLIKQCSVVGGRVLSQRVPSVSHGGYWRDLARRACTHSCSPGGCSAYLRCNPILDWCIRSEPGPNEML